jgi:hypothetical protein
VVVLMQSSRIPPIPLRRARTAGAPCSLSAAASEARPTRGHQFLVGPAGHRGSVHHTSPRGPRVKRVRDETVALHGGYEGGPKRAVAVPTYKTVAHDFENATHAGAVFDLDQAGPTTTG